MFDLIYEYWVIWCTYIPIAIDVGTEINEYSRSVSFVQMRMCLFTDRIFFQFLDTFQSGIGVW